MVDLKLSILIPTFNRSKFLKKNLVLLIDFIKKTKNSKNIEIIVSNNKSTDNTSEIVSEFEEMDGDIILKYYNQKSNIGLQKNALFVLQKSKGLFVMYLGDDDFIDIEYLKAVIFQIHKNQKLGLLLPSKKTINSEGKYVGGGRDFNLPNKHFSKGFKSCLRNGWRGHQLSGVVYKRKGLLSSYLKNKVDNIYPFIFFASISALKFETFHLTQYPVKVTEITQDKKDWGYGSDGLINEIFDNYNKLPLNYFQKSILQLNQIKSQSWRLDIYKKNNYWKAFFLIMFSKNSTVLFSLIFPFLITVIELYKLAKSLRKLISKSIN